MTSNVVQLRKPLSAVCRSLDSIPQSDTPLALSIPAELARSIRFTAGMHCKDPQAFVLDWLKSGFPENAA